VVAKGCGGEERDVVLVNMIGVLCCLVGRESCNMMKMEYD